MNSQLPVNSFDFRSKSIHNRNTFFFFEHPTRRKSCYCNHCGKKSHFQQQHANLPTQKEIDYQIQVDNLRKQSLCDEIRTEIPSELSVMESENGRLFRNSNRSISIVNQYIKRSMNFDQFSLETTTKLKRRSCECSECGNPTSFQRKHEDLSLPKRDKKMKQFLIRKHRNLIKGTSKQFQFSSKKIIVQKSIISSPQSQKSFQIKQFEQVRRTQDINKLVLNRISTRDLEQTKQVQGKYSIINSCKQLDSPQFSQSKSQRQILHKPTMSFSTISTSKWKSYKNTKDFQ
ncbi:unnamed protein product (macronuclear) [Paramecium tetraurelia]|uniref:Uncharacterized protein n=1 Tax=Paramecium tetraurelia TaxID=5888 RepID=A0BG03_PARTE|nr:uncharacterized protein GSPATT00028505001 [Paramecium tetraurelia]CAK57470.1 unnamed protein product [Paramecium tetraurelia]|eukprot:XP_001424868.1 hypothetical protein (macronuclear) [Paramecium tetraurelia strain d4-2]